MNKKLIKQLKGVGFINYKEKNHLYIIVVNGFQFAYNAQSEDFSLKGDHEPIMFATTESISDYIKKITGEDFIFKKTKREEIEELKAETKRIGSNYDKLFDLYDKLEKDLRTVKDGHGIALEGLGEHLNLLNARTDVLEGKTKIAIRFVETQKEVDKQVSEMQAEEAKGSYGFVKIDNQGTWKGSRVEVVTETNLGATVKLVHYNKDETRFFKFNELCLDREPVKQEAKEEKAFEVGDPVVLSCKCFSFLTKEYIDKKVFKVGSILDGCHALLKDGSWFRTEETEEILYFNHDQLEHAPEASPKEKALEFGGWAKTLGSDDIDDGTTVLLTRYVAPNWECRIDSFHSGVFHIQPKHLKPL